MDSLQYYINEHIKTKWECGDLSEDSKRLKKDFNLKNYKLGWSVINHCIELWTSSKSGHNYLAASFSLPDYSYGRLYRHLRECELRTHEKFKRDLESVREQNEKHTKGKQLAIAEECGEYLHNKLNGRVINHVSTVH